MLFARFVCSKELKSQYLLLAIIYTIFVPACCAVVTALEITVARTAPGIPDGNPVQTYTILEGITVQVIETEIKTSAFFAYRILKRSPLRPPIKKLQRLSKKKAEVLANKISKRDAKTRKRVMSRNKRSCIVCQVSADESKTF